MEKTRFLKRCKACNKEFWTIPSKVQAGKGKYCSQDCYWKTLEGKRLSPETEFTSYRVGGKNNCNWKGDNVGYDALHDWVKRRKPKPDFCGECGEYKELLHCANISGLYLRDLNDWRYMCVSCHKKYDLWRVFTFWHYCNIYRSAKIGKGTKIGSYCEIGDRVEIGDHCSIQSFAFIPRGVLIGDKVFIGPRVTFTNDKNPPSKKIEKTIVGVHASIGAGAVILPGVTIGRRAVVGAGSVVTKSIPDNEVWVGVPAKLLYKKI